MLAEFSISNFRNIDSLQIFSMLAMDKPGRAKHGHVHRTCFPDFPLVISEACLLGANGAGKTVMLEAMQTMSEFIRDSFEKQETLPFAPFLFDKTGNLEPSEFEVQFIKGRTLYYYRLEFDSTRVHREYLYARTPETGYVNTIFERKWLDHKDKYAWKINSAYLKGRQTARKKATRQDGLFLSTAVGMNEKSLLPVYEWLTGKWQFAATGRPWLETRPEHYINDITRLQEIIDFMNNADIPLKEMKIGKNGSIHVLLGNKKNTTLELPLEKLSAGTRKLLGLSVSILDALAFGHTLCIDDLDTNLHPSVCHHLLNLFAVKSLNPKNAQLIFSSHDPLLADRAGLHRDQVWMMELNREMAAQLVPLSDFKWKKSDRKKFAEPYLDGRFGGVPIIPF